MCMDAPPIKALNYLQTEVSSVVDHSNAEETSVFRSLLGYLLVPSESSGFKKPPTRDDVPSRLEIPAGLATGESSPMKIVSPENEPEGESIMFVAKDEEMGEFVASPTSTDVDSKESTVPAPRQAVTMQADPIEREISGGKAPSAEIFKERTDVFEQLMVFVNDDAKQPDKDLIKLVNLDKGDF